MSWNRVLSTIQKMIKLSFSLMIFLNIVRVKEVNFNTSLNYYLRNVLHLTGTKRMCQEGGCGTCIVAVKKENPVTKEEEFISVNSCLVSIFSCNGWKIYTVESLQKSPGELHPVQRSLAKHHGSQCGFCSPGMIMNMYVLYENGNLEENEVENSFGGNICRCTGYRPILGAFKSLCKAPNGEIDIEDANKCYSNCKINKLKCMKGSETKCEKYPYYYKINNKLWIKVFNFNDLMYTLRTFGNTSYMLLSGNTAQGVYKHNNTDIFIDISDVKELNTFQIERDKLILGANITLTNAVRVLKDLSKTENFSYLKTIAEHIGLIANVPVRNTGTLAGNIMMKKRHPNFPSDIFVILEGAKATLLSVDTDGKEYLKLPSDFINSNLSGEILKSVILTKINDNEKFVSYKIMPRAENAHALLNAAFLLEVSNEYKVKSANLVYGNISENFVHASKTENYLINKSILDNQTLQNAFRQLEEELQNASSIFMKQLAISLLYKFILSIVARRFISPRNLSGCHKLERLLSKSLQDFETNESSYPLTQPLRKVEMLAQITGEAEFINDIPDLPNQLFAAFVLGKAPPNSIIDSIDTKKALKVQGVVAYFDKNDIPGKNNFMPQEANLSVEEEIFSSGIIKYYYQPVGIIVATSEENAHKAADLVDITYKNSGIPYYTTIRGILEEKVEEKIHKYEKVIPKRKGNNSKQIIKGTVDLSWQYHFHMENQCCNVIPNEDGLDVYPSSQWLDLSQTAIATALNIPANKVNVSIRRLGGGFGAKISRNSLVACATALAAYKLKKPVKMWLSLETNMNVMGKRYPLASNYEVGVDDNGIIQYLKNDFYADYGIGGNEPSLPYVLDAFTSSYNTDTWEINAFYTKSDTAANCWIRAPGTTEGSAMIESIMDHIAYALEMDPLELRLANLNFTKHPKLKEYILNFVKSADIGKRKEEIEQFNLTNRWRKKGISVVPMAYSFHLFANYGVIVSIYQADGSVSIAHGGVEMGQGINTKVAQTAAYKFGINIEKITVKPSNNLIAPNSSMSGGSLTSEGVCYGVIKACDILIDRMKPIKERIPNICWEDLVKKCFMEFVNLSASSMSSPKEPDLKDYTVYGVCASEVDVDILTGQYIITRVDILEDAGVSMNPALDIGQIEGGFVMGLGYYTSEEILFGENGEILTNRTWNYKPPGAKDIPVDFRVELVKNSSNPVGVLHSKATGEPPMCLSCSVPLAIRNAVASARKEVGFPSWYPFNGPSTVENTFLNCVNDYKFYTL